MLTFAVVTWAGCSPAVVTRAGCSPAAAPLRCLAAAALLLLAPQAFGQEFLLSTPQQIPILAREALPQLQTLSGNINISMTATTVEVSLHATCKALTCISLRISHGLTCACADHVRVRLWCSTGLSDHTAVAPGCPAEQQSLGDALQL